MTSKFIIIFKVFPTCSSPEKKDAEVCTVPATEKVSSLVLVRHSLEIPSSCSAKKQDGSLVRNKTLAVKLFKRSFSYLLFCSSSHPSPKVVHKNKNKQTKPQTNWNK